MSVDAAKEAEKNGNWTGDFETRAIAAAARIKTLFPKFAYIIARSNYYFKVLKSGKTRVPFYLYFTNLQSIQGG